MVYARQYRNRLLAHREPITVACLFLAALALRSIQIGALPVTDEAITRRLIQQYTLFELPVVIPRIQPNTPLYYMIVKVWSYAFPIESARLLSVVAGSLTPVVTFLFGRELVSDRRAILAAWLVLLSPVLINHSYWLRMYGILPLVVICGWWHAYKVINRDVSIVPYFALALATVGLHPFGIAAVVGQVAWLSIEQYKTEWKARFRPIMAICIGTGTLVITPLLARVFGFLGPANISFTSMHTSYGPNPILKAILLPLTTLTGTLHFPDRIFIALVLTAGLLALSIKQRVWSTRDGRLLCAAILFPLVVLYAGHLIYPVMMLKYVGWLAPGVALTVVYTIQDVRVLATVVAVLVGIAVVHLLFGQVLHMKIGQLVIWNLEYADRMGVA